MLGTVVNTLAVMAGAGVGLALRRKTPEKSMDTIFSVVGLFTLYLGFSMASETARPVSLILGSLLGTLLGEKAGLEEALTGLAERVRKRVGGGGRFVEGLITAFLTFCVGPMTIVGSLRDGMGDPSIILAKSVMDCFVAVAYSAAMGVGVFFSAFFLLAFQGSLAIIGAYLGEVFPSDVVREITAAGGLILLGLGLNLLRLRKLKVGNMLPSLATVPLLSYFLKM